MGRPGPRAQARARPVEAGPPSASKLLTMRRSDYLRVVPVPSQLGGSVKSPGHSAVSPP